MGGIFICYRRDDAPGYAGRLYDRLIAHFGADRVFMDVQGIEPGVDFIDAIERALGSCEILIVLIGKDWLATDGAGKRRLDDPADFVRLETSTALTRGIRVVPVLVEGAQMPASDQLPRELLSLVRRQAVELSHKQWDATSAELIRTLEKILDREKDGRGRAGVAATAVVRPESSERTRDGAPRDDPGERKSSRVYWLAGTAVAVVAAGVVAYTTQPWRRADQPVVARVGPPSDKRAVTSDRPAATADKSAVTSDKPAVTSDKPATSDRSAAAAEKAAGFGDKDSSAGQQTAETSRQSSASSTSARTAESQASSAPAVPASTEARPQSPAPLAVPNVIGKSQHEAVAEVEKAGLTARVTESKRAAQSAAANSVLAQTPKAGVRLEPGERVTLEIASARSANLPPADATPPVRVSPRTATAPTAPAASTPSATATAPMSSAPSAAATHAAPSAFPRVGDSWQYAFKSMWKNVEPQTFVHQVTAVSDREVRETLSFVAKGTRVSDSKSFDADNRFVEWRGQGYYFVEFNPFIQAFGALQPGTSWKGLNTPVEDSFFSKWYSQGKAMDWESVSVPAGNFKALRVEINSNRNADAASAAQGIPTRVRYVIWYAPDVKRTVKHLRTVWASDGRKLSDDSYELVKMTVQ